MTNFRFSLKSKQKFVSSIIIHHQQYKGEKVLQCTLAKGLSSQLTKVPREYCIFANCMADCILLEFCHDHRAIYQ